MGWRVSESLDLVWGGRGKTASVFRRSCDCSKKQQQNYRLTFKKLPFESRRASYEYDFWPHMSTFSASYEYFFGPRMGLVKNGLVATNVSPMRNRVLLPAEIVGRMLIGYRFALPLRGAQAVRAYALPITT